MARVQAARRIAITTREGKGSLGRKQKAKGGEILGISNDCKRFAYARCQLLPIVEAKSPAEAVARC